MSSLVSARVKAIQLLCRGSTGFGEAALQSLLSNISTNDVQDCMAALEKAVSQGKLQ